MTGALAEVLHLPACVTHDATAFAQMQLTYALAAAWQADSGFTQHMANCRVQQRPQSQHGLVGCPLRPTLCAIGITHSMSCK